MKQFNANMSSCFDLFNSHSDCWALDRVDPRVHVLIQDDFLLSPRLFVPQKVVRVRAHLRDFVDDEMYSVDGCCKGSQDHLGLDRDKSTGWAIRKRQFRYLDISSRGHIGYSHLLSIRTRTDKSYPGH